jgi:hypothetical protein
VLSVVLHAPRGPFYSPKGPRSCWSSIWKALVALCPWVHRTVRYTPDSEQCNSYKILDWLVSCSRGYQTIRWGAPDCSILHLTQGHISLSIVSTKNNLQSARIIPLFLQDCRVCILFLQLSICFSLTLSSYSQLYVSSK